MASKTNTGLVAYAKAQVGNPYWYGTFGQLATEALLKSKMAQYPGQFEGSRPATARAKHIGKRVHDCCGLIKGYLWCSTPTSAPKYVAAQDINVGGLKQRCKAKGGIKTIPDIIGLLLFRGTSHVGIYIGDGWVIEAKGFDHGVVRSRLADGNWDTWGNLHWITYEAAKPVQPDKPVTGSIVKGSRVKVKSGAKTYDGKGIASFVYAGTYIVDELDGNRAVLDRDGGICTAFKTGDLILVSGGGTPTKTVTKGCRVKVKTGAKTYDGKGVASFVYGNTYTVDELKGDRAVLDRKGICTAFRVVDLVVQ